MTIRCGIDMIEIERIRRGIDRFGDRFLNRFFTANERAACADQPHRLAARYAGKEAVAKALGTGIGDISWQEIEILPDARGRPVLHLHGAAAALAAEIGLHQWDISLTHTETLASAVVVAGP
ncbi:MAG: holo-ACP synthase [bacterium]|nr:holo-ACP synthase [bacterium]